ncbi:MAG TPA: GNAT family N-acetyltransferase [Nocardioidaceae bacterium]|nr:GNAT family N-acetyltransferase [Nocardioidaceae bacterium]
MTAVSSDTAQVTVEARWGKREMIDRLAPEWRQLCNRAEHDEPFYRPEWVSTYLDAFEPDAHLLLLEARVEGRLTAVLPLVETRGGWRKLWARTLQGAANIHSCRFDIPRERGQTGEASVAKIWSTLRGLPGWDLVIIPRVPSGGAADALVSQAARDGYPTGLWRGWQAMESPYLEVDLAPGEDPTTIAGHAHFRRNVRRRLRRAMEKYEVRLRRVEDADPEALEAFFELERRSWKGTTGTAIACNEATRYFYTAAATVAAQSGYLSLYFLDFDGVPVAGHLGLRYKGRYYMPKVAYDEDYAKYSPGHLLLRGIIEDCAKDGPAVVDFLGLMAPWKADWTDLVLPHSSCFVYGKGVRGRLLHFARFSVLAAARTAAHLPSLEPSAQAVLQWRKRRRPAGRDSRSSSRL